MKDQNSKLLLEIRVYNSLETIFVLINIFIEPKKKQIYCIDKQKFIILITNIITYSIKKYFVESIKMYVELWLNQ